MPQHRTEAEWLDKRTTGLGASEVAGAVGMHPWCGRFETWLLKTGRMEKMITPRLQEQFMIAHLMEPVVVKVFQHRTGGTRKIVNPGQFTTVQHPEHDWLFATPDYYQHDPERGRGILECKNTGHYSAAAWEHSIPLQYQIQAQIQMACAGLYWGTVCSIIDRHEFKMYDIDRDDVFLESLLREAEHFWKSYVLANYPPPICASDSTSKSLDYLHPRDKDGKRVSIESLIVVAGRYDDIALQMKKLKQEKKLLENLIKDGMKDATYADLPDGSTFSWKHWEKKGYTVGDKEGRTLRRQKAKK